MIKANRTKLLDKLLRLGKSLYRSIPIKLLTGDSGRVADRWGSGAVSSETYGNSQGSGSGSLRTQASKNGRGPGKVSTGRGGKDGGEQTRPLPSTEYSQAAMLG
jgi:hypothetical protein